MAKQIKPVKFHSKNSPLSKEDIGSLMDIITEILLVHIEEIGDIPITDEYESTELHIFGFKINFEIIKTITNQIYQKAQIYDVNMDHFFAFLLQSFVGGLFKDELLIKKIAEQSYQRDQWS